ncbi:MAG: signal peptidase II [Clostridiales bacterium]|nr:signal peptidase II [Clostridiales bacterium]
MYANNIFKKGLIGAVLSALLIGFDQLTKYWAVSGLKDKDAFVLWNGVFELRYLENRGAAFGILQGQKWPLVIFTIVILAILIYVFLNKIPMGKKFFFLDLISILFFAGAIGNFIDRIAQDYVIDFFYFCLIDFPIFNVADIYVTVAAFLLIVLGFFYYKDEDWEKIFPAKHEK